MIRVSLPHHLKTLADVKGEIYLDVGTPATISKLLDSLEQQYPVLRGTIRDPQTGQRRPMIRFFACLQDMSLQPPETALPDRIRTGEENFLIVGAIAGG